MSVQEAVVDARSAGMRLDVFLTRQFSCGMEPGLSRSGMQRLIVGGQVTVNGQRSKPSLRLRADDIVAIRSLPAKELSLTPEPLPLDILFEDEDCVVINKPAGMIVHPAAGVSSGTLVNALLHHCPDLKGIGGERRPGIVHRLDKETSGAMIIAKTDFAFQQLARQFRNRRVSKEYVALVWGQPKNHRGTINRAIGRHRSDRKRMSSLYPMSPTREAVTEWEVEVDFAIPAKSATSVRVSLLRLRPRTGRTHQIRVHLTDLGFPLVGDKVYGRKRRPGFQGACDIGMLLNFGRQALHAEKLGLVHPRSALPMTFHAPLAQDIRNLLQWLEGTG